MHWFKWSAEEPYDYCISLDLPVYVCCYLLYAFRCSYFVCIDIYKLLVWLISLSLCNSFFVSSYSLCFKVFCLVYVLLPQLSFCFHLHEILVSMSSLLVNVCLLIWGRSLAGSTCVALVFSSIQPPCAFYWCI